MHGICEYPPINYLKALQLGKMIASHRQQGITLTEEKHGEFNSSLLKADGEKLDQNIKSKLQHRNQYIIRAVTRKCHLQHANCGCTLREK